MVQGLIYSTALQEYASVSDHTQRRNGDGK